MLQTRTNLLQTSSAVFSSCGSYRYRLQREIGPGEKTLLFIGLNPSTADEEKNDPTVERIERRAKAMGFGRISVCNIFAYRATDPQVMKGQPFPVGPENDAAILEEARKADLVLCAWGIHGCHLNRGREVEKLLRNAGIPLHCLGRNHDGSPKHPLYIGYDRIPVRWEKSGNISY